MLAMALGAELFGAVPPGRQARPLGIDSGSAANHSHEFMNVSKWVSRHPPRYRQGLTMRLQTSLALTTRPDHTGWLRHAHVVTDPPG